MNLWNLFYFYKHEEGRRINGPKSFINIEIKNINMKILNIS